MKFVVIFLLATIASIVSPVAYATDAFLVNCPHAGQTPTAGTLYTCAVSFNGAGTFEVLNASDGQVGSLALAYSNANAYPSLQIATLDVIFPTAGQYHTRTTSVAGVVNNPPFTVIAGSNPPPAGANSLIVNAPASVAVNSSATATATATFSGSTVASYSWTDGSTGVSLGTTATISPTFTALGNHAINLSVTSASGQTLASTWSVNVVTVPSAQSDATTVSSSVDGCYPTVQIGQPVWLSLPLPTGITTGAVTVNWCDGVGWVTPGSFEMWIKDGVAHVEHVFPKADTVKAKFRIQTADGVFHYLPSMTVRVVNGVSVVISRNPSGVYSWIEMYGADGVSPPNDSLLTIGLFLTQGRASAYSRGFTLTSVTWYKVPAWAHTGATWKYYQNGGPPAWNMTNYNPGPGAYYGLGGLGNFGWYWPYAYPYYGYYSGYGPGY